MKKIITVGIALCCLLALAACGNSASEDTVADNSSTPQLSAETESTLSPEAEGTEETGNELRVRLSFDGGEAILLLNDNAAARDFASQLPLTQTFEDFNSIEKICRLQDELTTEGVDTGVDPDIADVTLYIPWNTLVFYYDDYGHNDDLISIGRVESGMELLAEMGDEFEVTMELADEDVTDTKNETNVQEAINISMTVGDTVVTAALDNSETTQAFLATLPRTLTMNHYGGREYYGRIEALPENGEAIADFENGDVTYYPAGPSLAIFFAGEDSSSQGGLIRMGKITSDLSVFEALGDSVEMHIEVAE